MLRSYNNFHFLEEIYPNNSPVKKVVFLLHGYAQRASFMHNAVAVKMSREMPGVKFISINGMQECKGYEGKRRYDWLRYNGNEWNPDIIKKVADEVSKQIAEFVFDILESYSLKVSDSAFIGFSQGTRVSLHTSIRIQQPCAGVLGYSGALSLPESISSELVSRPEILLVHGVDDEVLSYKESLYAKEVLMKCGVSVKVKLIKDLKHKINEEGIDFGVKFLKEQLEIT